MKKSNDISVRVPGYPRAHWEWATPVSAKEAAAVADRFVCYDPEGGYSLFWAGQYLLVWD